MLRLPLDFSTFKEMRETGYLYVDKTRHAYNLITLGKYYFLSRPRRFGKSLLISMLKELLSANREPFKGLWIDQSDYSWQKYGVIKLDFSSLGIHDVPSFNKGTVNELQSIADSYALSVELDESSPEISLKRLALSLHKKFGKVALLIDEYDSPILHALHDEQRAKEIRDTMQRFFAAVKGMGEHINFVFITGVSSFAKAGLFSGINNLRIITLEQPYETICGYTQEEVEHYFPEYLAAWSQESGLAQDELKSKIKEFYNGYAFGEHATKVYNPFSLMHALDKQRFDNFWIQSGTPSFLIHELTKKYRQEEYRLFDPTTFRVGRDSLGSFDVGSTPLPALLFQAGYLTVRDYDEERNMFLLGYPNSEVKEAMQKYLVSVFTQIPIGTVNEAASDLELALQEENIEEAVIQLKRLFAHIPYQLHAKEEKFYHALLHMIFNTYNMRVISEQATSHGRIDLVVTLKSITYIIETKFNDVAESALKQIKDMRYYEPFVKKSERIILLGLAFNRSEKQFDIAYAYEVYANK